MLTLYGRCEQKKGKNAMTITIDEVKQEIEKRTGVQASLLKGETIEECMSYAKAVIAFRNEHAEKHPEQRQKSTKEQFAEWVRNQDSIQEKRNDLAGWMGAHTDAEEDNLSIAPEMASLLAYERELIQPYPELSDYGEQTNLPDYRTAKEQFAEWMGDRLAFDPSKGDDGWRRVL